MTLCRPISRALVENSIAKGVDAPKEAEAFLLHAFERLDEKAALAVLLGDHYFGCAHHKGRDLLQAVEWYAKAIALDTQNELWLPYAYLGGVYERFGLARQAAALHDAAADVHGSPVSLDEHWQSSLCDLLIRDRRDMETIVASLEQLWDAGLGDQAAEALKP